MMVSKQEEYGLRCILQVARVGVGNLVSVNEIAKREGLSPQNVTKLLSLIRKAGLVATVRGIKGGFTLKRHPKEIFLAEVMRTLGGCPNPNEFCASFPGKLHECCHTPSCSIRPLWLAIVRQIDLILRRVTLADLLMGEPEVEQLIAARLSQLPTAPAPVVSG